MSSAIKNIKRETEKILVLLVDDQAMVGEGVRRMLEADPAIAFHYVSDPKEALESAIKIAPTVILQDLVMPGVNGLDLLKEYRNHPSTRAVPVIVLSSKEEPAVKQIAFESELTITWSNCRIGSNCSRGCVCIPKRTYTNCNGRERFRLSKRVQRELTEKNCELELLNQKVGGGNSFQIGLLRKCEP